MKILNGNEAFAAMAAGQNIECRLINQDHGFQDIKQFTATVYFDPRYEFRVAIKFFTIGEMQVPEAIQEAPAKGVQCFAPSILTEELSKSFKWKSSNSDLMLMERGQVHLIQEHAEIHAQALIKISGGSFDNVQNSTSSDVEKKTFDEPDVWKTSVQEAHEISKETREKAEALMTSKPVSDDPIETDAVKLVEKFTAEINAAETEDAVMQIRYKINPNTYMVRGQIIELNKLAEKRIAALNASVDEDGDLKIKELQRLQVEAENLIKNGIGQQAEPTHEHQEHLEILLNDIALAKTPLEANAQIKYTKSWTQEQRKPVMQAINKRLIELKSMEEPKSEETPSLMVQIQNAPDLTALDVLEIDVGSRHPDIQSKLMGYVKKRRFELENGAGPVGAPL